MKLASAGNRINPVFYLSNQLSHPDKYFAFVSISDLWTRRYKILFRNKLILYWLWCFYKSWCFQDSCILSLFQNSKYHINLNTRQTHQHGYHLSLPIYFTIISFENLTRMPWALLFGNQLPTQLWNTIITLSLRLLSYIPSPTYVSSSMLLTANISQTCRVRG